MGARHAWATLARLTPPETREQHAIGRARERYGLDLSRADVRWIGWAVHCGVGRWICTQDDTRSVYEVDFNDTAMVVVYDPVGRSVRTFLPPRDGMTNEQYVDRIREFYEWEE